MGLLLFFILIPLWTIGLIVGACKIRAQGGKVFDFLDDL